MRKNLGLVGVVCALFGLMMAGLSGATLRAGDKDKDGAAEKELKKLEGTWVLVAGEEKGKKLSEELLKKSKLVIIGNKHEVHVGDTVIKGTHKLNPAKKPKQIDASDTEGPYAGKGAHGIYEIKGDEFKVCFSGPGKDRPTEFSTSSGAGEILHVWKKAKKK
jgi:uncharacterized protein (TIGR03067 family)